MLKKLSSNKYTLAVGGRTHTILFSLGLRDELFESVSDVYRKFLEFNPEESLIPKEVQVEFLELQQEITEAETDEERAVLYQVLAQKKAELIEMTSVLTRAHSQQVQEGMLRAIKEFKYDIWATLLTKRDLQGQIVDEVTVEDIKNKEEYSEDDVQEGLEELLAVVLGMVEDRLKKSLATKGKLEEIAKLKEA